MNRAEMVSRAATVANEAIAEANGDLSDAKQIVHMALCLLHADESEQRRMQAEKAAKVPGRPR